MTRPDFIAKAVYRFEGEGDDEYTSSIILYENKPWLVATWLGGHATGEQYPEWLVPMEKLNADWKIRYPVVQLGVRIPKMLVSEECPAELRRAWGAMIHPDTVHIPGPKSSH
ncbi:MAG: hypothetical protein HYY78_15370 [Betaproteobacteria bacterium]|nr:hypothetical protein [Betaproteobacteria bacterium]